MPAGWTIQQITHCSAGLACSDSLVNRSSASALGEADLTTTATISRRVGKTLSTYAATIVDQFLADQAVVDDVTTGVTTSATIATIKAKTATASATVTTAATLGAVKVAAPPPGGGVQDYTPLLAAV